MTLTVLYDPAPATPRGPTGRFRVHAHDAVLVRALWQILAEVAHLWPADRVLTVGDEHANGEFDVLVVAPTPLACRAAVARATEGSVSIVLTSDRLDDLAPALLALGGEIVHLPRRVLDLANDLPELSWREIEILRALLLDQSNSGLSRRLGISDATLKRCLTSLMTRLGVANRAALVARAVQLGIGPAALR